MHGTTERSPTPTKRKVFGEVLVVGNHVVEKLMPADAASVHAREHIACDAHEPGRRLAHLSEALAIDRTERRNVERKAGVLVLELIDAGDDIALGIQQAHDAAEVVEAKHVAVTGRRDQRKQLHLSTRRYFQSGSFSLRFTSALNSGLNSRMCLLPRAHSSLSHFRMMMLGIEAISRPQSPRCGIVCSCLLRSMMSSTS